MLAERLLENTAASLDLGSVDRVGARAMQEAHRRQGPTSIAVGWAWRSHRSTRSVAAAARLAVGNVTAGSVVVEVGGGVVERRRRQRRLRQRLRGVRAGALVALVAAQR